MCTNKTKYFAAFWICGLHLIAWLVFNNPIVNTTVAFVLNFLNDFAITTLISKLFLTENIGKSVVSLKSKKQNVLNALAVQYYGTVDSYYFQ